jgi:hypothetical protein
MLHEAVSTDFTAFYTVKINVCGYSFVDGKACLEPEMKPVLLYSDEMLET